MNSERLVEIIQKWASFNDNGPSGSIREFALWLLDKDAIETSSKTGELDLNFKLLELSRLLEMQTKTLFDGDAYELQFLQVLKIVDRLLEPAKQTVVAESLLEASTGFYLIKMLVERGLLKQKPDPRDGRSLRVSLTAKGREFLRQKLQEFKKISVLPGRISVSEKKTFIRMLNTVHQYHRLKISGKTEKK